MPPTRHPYRHICVPNPGLRPWRDPATPTDGFDPGAKISANSTRFDGAGRQRGGVSVDVDRLHDHDS
jgi:hypothetical protein